MRRRELLWTAGVGIGSLLTAGCLSGDPAARADRRLELDRVETPTAAVRLNEVDSTPQGQAPTVESLSDPEREVAMSALDDGYRTDDPALSDWLVTFVAETPYLRRDGIYYRLEHDFPRYTITAEETTEAAVEGQIADAETYEQAVTHDGVRETALLEHARQGGVTLVDIWPSLREFLETYDAVRTRGLLAVSLTVTDDGPPYEVTAKRVGPTDLTDESVYDATDAPERVRTAVRAAGRTTGVYAGSLPEELLDAVETHQYVYLDGTFYWAALENRGDLPVTVEAEVIQSSITEADEPRLRLALVNEGDSQVSVFSGAPAPFGVLHIEAMDSAKQSLLWTDAYRQTTHVDTRGRSVTSVEDVGLTTPLAAGDTLDRTFTVVDPLAVGAYVVRNDVGIELPDAEGGALSYRVYLRVVEERE